MSSAFVKPLENEKEVQHLKTDENIFLASKSSTNAYDTNLKKSSSSTFLRGRKASTYLRIFRNDDNNEDEDTINKIVYDDPSNEELIGVTNNVEIINNVETNEESIRPNKSGIHKLRDNGSNIFNATLESSDKGKTISSYEKMTKEIQLPKNVQYSNLDSSFASSNSIKLEARIPDTTLSANQSTETIPLTPISSATYYPHTSKENDGDLIFTTPLASSRIDPERIDNILYDHLNNETKVKSNNIQTKHDTDDIDLANQQPNDIMLQKHTKPYDQIHNSQCTSANEDDENNNEYPLAVELQPFTNNVGGHTAIFRFSKRAVCKALVNRENKWYETIELNHKELLKFMPRYIGVLNVRRHFRSKEDFLRELSNTKKKKMEKKYKQFIDFDSENKDSINYEQLKVAKSHPYDSRTDITPMTPQAKFAFVKPQSHVITKLDLDNMNEYKKGFKPENSINYGQFLLPEVVLNDNKHIIPDSLWDKYSHSSNSAPNNLNSYANSNTSYYNNDYIHNNNQNKVKYRCDSGSTTVNTKLQELVLQEVFAPAQLRRNKSSLDEIRNAGSDLSLSNSMIRNMSGYDNSQNKSSSTGNNASIDLPLLQKSIQEGISNAVDSAHSVMDLQQFHKKEIAREHSKMQMLNKVNENSKIDISQSMHIPLSNRKFKIDDDDQDQLDMLPLSLSQSVDKTSLDNEIPINDPQHKQSDSNTSMNSPTANNDSVTFEEHSDTIVSKFILLEDLTQKLNKPCALDLKMGTRQYGVDASSAKQLSQSKKCLNTTSRKLGVRLCGLKIWDQNRYICRDKYFGRRVKIGWQFTRIIARFFYNGLDISSVLSHIPALISQLDTLSIELNKLKGYRLYGASLLIMYDGNPSEGKKSRVTLNLIDFARSVTKADMNDKLDEFRIPPKSPYSEDRGFIRGVKSLKFYLTVIWNHLTNDEPIIFDEDELEKYLFIDNKEMFANSWDWLDTFDTEDEIEFNDTKSELRKKWRKYELIFDVEPRYNDDDEISD